jgi:hypothetical protein
MVGSVCSVKWFTAGRETWQTFRWWWRGWNGGAEVAETTVKRLLCCGFRRSGKAMGQVYQCWWRVCREINVFSKFECHMFYVLYPFVTYLLTLPRTLFKGNIPVRFIYCYRLCSPQRNIINKEKRKIRYFEKKKKTQLDYINYVIVHNTQRRLKRYTTYDLATRFN